MNMPTKTVVQHHYPDDFKEAAARRVVAGESRNAVAKSLGISVYSVSRWTKRWTHGEKLTKSTFPAATGPVVEIQDRAPMSQLVREAIAQRNERLELAAEILELDGGIEGLDIAHRIRTWKRDC